ncbi:MAG: bifunctional folylpolyglutamate synthase/dihydrofolate synthase [Gemmatimonadota bacterium]
MTEPSGLTYEELTRELFPRLTGGIRWGLERTKALLESVDNPQHSFHAIHVGGTNGKGSVAATLAAILQSAGHHTGLYTSPHLCTFRERIQINGAAIGEAELVHAARRLWPAVQSLKPSFFEATTALGFLALAEAGVRAAVIEVGLGGRLDSTNVIIPDLAVITNIALDHADYLGNTIESVAREKAGIIKSSGPLITAERGALPLRIFEEHAARAGTTLHVLPPDQPANVSYDEKGTRLSVTTSQYGEQQLATPLIGAHQAVNTALAVHAAALLPDAFRPAEHAVVSGVRQVRWPGRMQIERLGSQTWIFDVAHNAAGVHALVDTVARLKLERPLVLVIGILGDKDWQAMLPPLFGAADVALLTVPPTAPRNRAWNPDRVLREVPSERAEVICDFSAALERAAEVAGDGTVLVTGSFHTVGDALIALGRAPFGSDLVLPHITISG